jgi:hypothetical protein
VNLPFTTASPKAEIFLPRIIGEELNSIEVSNARNEVLLDTPSVPNYLILSIKDFVPNWMTSFSIDQIESFLN